jgi:hypothetical protein
VPEVFITLEEAAAFEGVTYDTMKKRIQRNSSAFITKTQPREGGGKEQVMVSVASLSSKARKAHKAAQKVDGRDVIIEQRAAATPWFVEVDLNHYIESHKKQYYEAIELAKRCRSLSTTKAPTAPPTPTASPGPRVSTPTLYRYVGTCSRPTPGPSGLRRKTGRTGTTSGPSPFAGSRRDRELPEPHR